MIQYPGKCKLDPTHIWDKGDHFFYQKNPEVICSNESCFNKQVNDLKGPLERLKHKHTPSEQVKHEPSPSEQVKHEPSPSEQVKHEHSPSEQLEDVPRKIPAMNSNKLLVDTNVIREILGYDNYNPKILENIKKKFSTNGIIIYIIKRVLVEAEKVSKKDPESYSGYEILKKLKKDFETIFLPDETLDYTQNLEKLYDNTDPNCPCKKCKCTGKSLDRSDCTYCQGKGYRKLSFTDFILLIVAKEQDWVLVTRDKCLKKNAKKTLNRLGEPIVVYDPFGDKF